jgi:hypothetical protein
MTTRSWSVGDPEPRDHPPLVDIEDVTWLWDSDNELYERQKFTHHLHPDGSPGAVIGSPILDWREILEEYGPVREATAEESCMIVEAWPSEESRHRE